MVEKIETRCQRCCQGCYGDVVSAYGKYYHQYCFSCTVPGCKQDLAQVGFFLIEDEVYCRDDYRKLMGIQCAGCHKYVEGEAIAALESRFHPTCFGCISCGKVFPVGSEICYDGEDFTCQMCYDITPSSKVASPSIASEPVKDTHRFVPNEPVVVPKEEDSVKEEPEIEMTGADPCANEAKQEENNVPTSALTPSPLPTPESKSNSQELERLLKPKPVATVTPHIENKQKELELNSNEPIKNGRKIDAQEEIRAPYEDKKMSVCAGCNNFIKDGQALLALDKQWHLWCFTCHKCGALLTAEYMGRDGIPYCERDYQDQFGITCAGCNQYITGKVLQAGEKHYHPACSRCAKCGDMFGEGEDMYLQGNEIWHPACSDEQDDEDAQSDSTVSELSESEYPMNGEVTEEPTSSPSASPSKTHFAPAVWKPESSNINPTPYGQKPAGFRSVKPPGFPLGKPSEDVSTAPPTQVDDDETDDAPPVPPPPSRSSSSQWRSKYTTTRSVSSNSDRRPKSTIETTRKKPLPSDGSDGSDVGGGGGSDGEGRQMLSVAYSTNSLNSNSSSKSTNSFRTKGIGYNQLQHRMHSNSQKDVRNKLPTNIDPDRLRQFLEDPDHNVYLEDHEFVQIFKISREKFYSLPNSRKKELKNGILFT